MELLRSLPAFRNSPWQIISLGILVVSSNASAGTPKSKEPRTTQAIGLFRNEEEKAICREVTEFWDVNFKGPEKVSAAVLYQDTAEAWELQDYLLGLNGIRVELEVLHRPENPVYIPQPFARVFKAIGIFEFSYDIPHAASAAVQGTPTFRIYAHHGLGASKLHAGKDLIDELYLKFPKGLEQVNTRPVSIDQFDLFDFEVKNYPVGKVGLEYKEIYPPKDNDGPVFSQTMVYNFPWPPSAAANMYFRIKKL